MNKLLYQYNRPIAHKFLFFEKKNKNKRSSIVLFMMKSSKGRFYNNITSPKYKISMKSKTILFYFFFYENILWDSSIGVCDTLRWFWYDRIRCFVSYKHTLKPNQNQSKANVKFSPWRPHTQNLIRRRKNEERNIKKIR